MKGIADLLDSDMEDSVNFIDENSILSSASDATNASTTKAKRAKKRHRVTMPTKPRSKVQKAAPAQARKAAPKKATAAKRKALEEQVNDRDLEQAGDGQEVQEEEVAVAAPPAKTKKAPRTTAKSKAPKPVAVPEELEEDDMEIEQTPIVARSNHTAGKTKTESARLPNKNATVIKSGHPQPLPVVAESQHNIEQTDEEEPEPVVMKSAPPPKKSVARDTSRTRQEPSFRRRAGSASDTERGDPNLRRKLGDMTRKFENVDLKYRNLKEVGINEANANMEKLRRQCDATVQASNDLIASLKKELAAQTPQIQEARKLKKQMASQETEVNNLRQSATELGQALSLAQNEVKALQAKLAAARAAPPAEHVKPPGSAFKASVQRPVMMGSAEAVQAAQIAQMKEDLYSDLTGLIIRSVHKTKEGDTYDCLQTGRNGTLHFKLYVDHEDAKTTSFEETEFLYTPMLDVNRDREMIELMPSYLTEDITFARQNAAKFYGRVVDTLTKRRVEE